VVVAVVAVERVAAAMVVVVVVVVAVTAVPTHAYVGPAAVCLHALVIANATLPTGAAQHPLHLRCGRVRPPCYTTAVSVPCPMSTVPLAAPSLLLVGLCARAGIHSSRFLFCLSSLSGLLPGFIAFWRRGFTTGLKSLLVIAGATGSGQGAEGCRDRGHKGTVPRNLEWQSNRTWLTMCSGK
jgi:hypothetical protein